MAYRDDKEAAYQRADALQRELDRTQAELERTKGKLADTERARDTLAKKLTSGAKLSQPPAPPPLPTPHRRSGGAAIGSLFVIGAMSAFALNSSRHHYSPPPPPVFTPKIDFNADMAMTRQITLNSDPLGAQVYAKHSYGGEQFVGTTPLTMSVLDWTVQGQLEVRLDGYQPTSVEIPLFDKAISETTVTLHR